MAILLDAGAVAADEHTVLVDSVVVMNNKIDLASGVVEFDTLDVEILKVVYYYNILDYT